MEKNLFELRKEYSISSIDFQNVEPNPMRLYDQWFDEIHAIDDVYEPNTFVLSTLNDSKISSRVVLLKHYDEDGFRFFTNYQSNKAKAIESHATVAMNFHWHELQRQVCIQGVAEKLGDKENDEYFYSRPLASRAGAVLSDQSREVSSALDYEKELSDFLEKNKSIERPKHWGGYLIRPMVMEFWQGRPSRLHDRLVYKKNDGTWTWKRLAP